MKGTQDSVGTISCKFTIISKTSFREGIPGLYQIAKWALGPGKVNSLLNESLCMHSSLPV